MQRHRNRDGFPEPHIDRSSSVKERVQGRFNSPDSPSSEIYMEIDGDREKGTNLGARTLMLITGHPSRPFSTLLSSGRKRKRKRERARNEHESLRKELSRSCQQLPTVANRASDHENKHERAAKRPRANRSYDTRNLKLSPARLPREKGNGT